MKNILHLEYKNLFSRSQGILDTKRTIRTGLSVIMVLYVVVERQMERDLWYCQGCYYKAALNHSRFLPIHNSFIFVW